MSARKKDKEEKPKRIPKERAIFAPNCVTIFGGGISGMSAAHELVERGFRVQVWEPQVDERRSDKGCDVGGMARTQWSRVDWADETKVGSRNRNVDTADSGDWGRIRTQEIVPLPQVFLLRHVKEDEFRVVAAVGEYSVKSGDDCREVLLEMLKVLRETPSITHVYCEVQRDARDPDESAKGRDPYDVVFQRVNKVRELFNDYVKGEGELLKIERPSYVEQLSMKLKLWSKKRDEEKDTKKEDKREGEVTFSITLLDGFPEGLPREIVSRLSFRVRERWIPGEHGFRFFPSFYHHLFDTMKRTPILEPVEKSPIGTAQERSVTVNANPDKYVETGRTAFDNLRPTSRQILAFSDGSRPAAVLRSVPKSLEQLREWISLSFKAPKTSTPKTVAGRYEKLSSEEGGFGFTVRDMARYQVKLFQFLTTCDERRRDLEQMTWFDFIGGPDVYSQEFVDIMNEWPEALVAMDGETADARTHGAVLLQLLLDNFRPPGAFVDGTLSGPTSVAWLTPWRRYLEAQGVEFIHGKLNGFRRVADEAGDVVWPDVECYEPRYPVGDDDRTPALMPGYFLVAVSAEEGQRIARSYVDAGGTNKDFKRLAKMQLGADELSKGDPRGQLRHMVGIQYYFDEDVYWMDGHVFLPMSEWGISSISQVRFWQEKQDWEHGYRGILSVVLSTFDNADENGNGKTAFKCPPNEIAQRVWNQIQKALVDQSLPTPRYWHMDFNFEWDEKKKTYDNRSPYLINIPGTWDDRPGAAIHPKPGSNALLSGYDVNDGVVLAGTFMKTFTRLTTMEAANESARHAVNAILQDLGKPPGKYNRTEFEPTAKGPEFKRKGVSPCDIWPLDDREVDDLAFFKDLDAELYGRGLDHFIDILGIDDFVASVLRGSRAGVRDPLDPAWILAQLGRIMTGEGKRQTKEMSKRPAEEWE